MELTVQGMAFIYLFIYFLSQLTLQRVRILSGDDCVDVEVEENFFLFSTSPEKVQPDFCASFRVLEILLRVRSRSEIR